MSWLDTAQQQNNLIYLWQSRRGQYFFHTFEKSLGGRKWTSHTVESCAHGWALCLCVNWFWNCNVRVAMCSKTCVRLLAVLWGMVLLGSASRKSSIGLVSRSCELWLLTTRGLTSVALWGGWTSDIKLNLLSGGGVRRSKQFQHTQDVQKQIVWIEGKLSRQVIQCCHFSL